MPEDAVLYTNERLVAAAAANPSFLQLKSPRDPLVLDAMRRVDRRDFLSDEMFPLHDPSDETMDAIRVAREKLVGRMPRLPEEDNRKLMFIAANAAFSLMGSLETFNVSPRALAYNDITLPIGYDQRCSKPSLVAFMNDILDLHDGHTVLEIGAGCGYHAAVTRELIGASGRLTTVEIVPELAKKAAGNLKGYRNLDVVEGSGSSGYAKAAPYDRIYLTAGVKIYGFDERVFLDQMNTDDGAFLYPDPTAFNLARYEKGTLRRKRLQIGLSFVPLVDAR